MLSYNRTGVPNTSDLILKAPLCFFPPALLVTSPGPHFRKCLNLVIHHMSRGRLNHASSQHCSTEKHNGRLCFVLNAEFGLKTFSLSTKPGHRAQNNLNLISCCCTHEIKLINAAFCLTHCLATHNTISCLCFCT